MHHLLENRGHMLTLKISLDDLGHHEQVTNTMDMLEVKQRDEITNKTRGGDGEAPRVGLTDPDSRLSQFGQPPVSLADCLSRLSGLPLMPALQACLSP
jgi:hypothetical protein